ncbi:MAG: hypothetical protein D5R98_00590 [Desulfonatronovibrio sp. MSAO_Bac4]|nr:MAG: hypothetical protein D5R98_00590 [Desulfonatronovibrio sp. MSAO_Bac4]
MGELIQVRVTAKVHDQDRALKRWSGLSKIAFGQNFDQSFENKDLLSELVDALYDKDRLGQLPKNIDDALSKDIQDAHDYKKKLHSFLAERNPQEADKISYQLEDLLDKMEETSDN